jgi:OOP family OmpA-OmpF porin
VLVISATGVAEDGANAPRIPLPEAVRFSERSNLSRRDDGRYVGLINTQVDGYLARVADGIDATSSRSALYEGRFLRFEQTRRDMRHVARPVERSVEVTIRWSESALFSTGSEYPSYHGIPTLPSMAAPEGWLPGFEWEAPAELAINPLNDPEQLLLPVTVSYRYEGRDQLDGHAVHRVTARFATRYPLPPRPEDEDAPRVPGYQGTITRVTGSHNLTIFLPAETGATLLIRDELQEEYAFRNQPMSLVQGHRLLFVHELSTADRSVIRDDVEQTLLRLAAEDVSVEIDPIGVRLTLQAIHFVPDQAVILAAERLRLDAVAEALISIEAGRFLVVGHTADVGSPESQFALSRERAEVIAGELVQRGIDPDRIDTEGRGGSEPVVGNSTEEERAMNRRVEIYVLQ